MPGIKPTMDEWKAGTLHSGSKTGPIVRNQKQAIAIALSEKRKAGGAVPAKPIAKMPVKKAQPVPKGTWKGF